MQPDDSPAEQVQEAFTRLLRWAQRGDVRRSVLGTVAQTLSTHDITLLRTITAHGPVRASDLAAWQGVDKSTVTPQIRRLEERGLLTREGDPGDRRAALLTVTEQGRQRLRDIDRIRAGLFARALDGWADTDRRTLAELMSRFADDLADVPRESPAGRWPWSFACGRSPGAAD